MNLALWRKWSHFGSIPVPDSVERTGTGTGTALKERDQTYIKKGALMLREELFFKRPPDGDRPCAL